MTTVGLRIDVDTLRGTCKGVPNLIDLLARHCIRASFFFSVGPDNMGRHLWRLAHPTFLAKMLRTRASRLYGWDILLRGTLCPGPVIGKRCPQSIVNAARAGHETGLHAWDHHRWQTQVRKMDRAALTEEIQKGVGLMRRVLGEFPSCAAAPAWRVTPTALRAMSQFGFDYTSDCRGHSIFQPIIDGRPTGHPQVPTSLPTYDERVGPACSPAMYYEQMIGQIATSQFNVLAVHAEVEGLACLPLFNRFLQIARQKGVRFKPLGELLSKAGMVNTAGIRYGHVTGRQGWIARQGEPANRQGIAPGSDKGTAALR